MTDEEKVELVDKMLAKLIDQGDDWLESLAEDETVDLKKQLVELIS